MMPEAFDGAAGPIRIKAASAAENAAGFGRS
jgi:hypothetical protein